jgi:hypothetical protein
MNDHFPAWATRALITRKLKGLEDFIRKSSLGSKFMTPTLSCSCYRGFPSHGQAWLAFQECGSRLARCR